MDLQATLEDIKKRFKDVNKQKAKVQQHLNELLTEEVRLQGAYREIEAILEDKKSKKSDK